MADFVELGDLLVRYEEHEAALVEYSKAVPAEQTPSPLLSNRLAQAHLALEEPQEAAVVLRGSLTEYPEYPLTHKTLGQVHERLDRLDEARASFREAASYNPYDPEVREALVRLAHRAGDEAALLRHERALAIQRRGGDEVSRTPIHDREGTYELPRYDAHIQKARTRDAFAERWTGELAPSYLALDIDGTEIEPTAYAGKVVLLDFWATWCGPCRKAMPVIADLYDRKKGDGLEVIGLTDESESRVKPFLARSPVPYTVGVRAGDVKDRYEVTSLPTVFVIGRDGRVVDVVVGASDQALEQVEASVTKALEE